MRTEIVTAVEDKALPHAMRQLAVEEALPLTEREEALLLIGIRAGIWASFAIIAGDREHA